MRFRHHGLRLLTTLPPWLFCCHAAAALPAGQQHHDDDDSTPRIASPPPPPFPFSYFFFDYVAPNNFTVLANVAPPMRAGETQGDRDRIDALLHQYWSQQQCSRSNCSGYYYHQQQEEYVQATTSTTGTISNNNDTSSSTTERGVEFTYGEVSPLGVRQLAYFMNLHDDAGDHIRRTMTATTAAPPPVTFFDVGSGVGKLIVQLYLEHHHHYHAAAATAAGDHGGGSGVLTGGVVIDRAVGIEFCPIRHGIATKVWSAMQRRLLQRHPSKESSSSSLMENTTPLDDGRPPPSAQDIVVEFHHQDARDADFSAATHVFLGSLCFPPGLTDALSRRLLASAPQLQVVAALSELRLFHDNDGRSSSSSSSSWTKKTHEIQTSWGRARLYIYSRRRLEQQQ
jgi:hypothetical protein